MPDAVLRRVRGLLMDWRDFLMLAATLTLMALVGGIVGSLVNSAMTTGFPLGR